MHLTLLESHRSVFQVSECALVSILAHAGVVWLAVTATIIAIVSNSTENDSV